MLLKPSVKVSNPQVSFTRPLLRSPTGESALESLDGGISLGGCGGRAHYAGGFVVRGSAGGGVIDRPITTPDKSKQKGTSRRRPPIYRVMLHNDNYNSREYVVRVLVKVIDVLTLDEAVNVMQVAHVSGVSLVTACAQEDAEKYCQGLRNNGLTSTIEPDGGGSNSEA